MTQRDIIPVSQYLHMKGYVKTKHTRIMHHEKGIMTGYTKAFYELHLSKLRTHDIIGFQQEAKEVSTKYARFKMPSISAYLISKGYQVAPRKANRGILKALKEDYFDRLVNNDVNGYIKEIECWQFANKEYRELQAKINLCKNGYSK